MSYSEPEPQATRATRRAGGPTPALPALLAVAVASGALAQTLYVPGDTWERRAPEAVGMDADRLAEAVASAQVRGRMRDLRPTLYALAAALSARAAASGANGVGGYGSPITSPVPTSAW
jgi:hypothetical protein